MFKKVVRKDRDRNCTSTRYLLLQGNEDVLSSPLAPDDDSAGIWISSADDNFSTNNNNNNNNDNDNDSYSASKPASATIVTVVKKGGKTTAEESSFVGGGGSADSMRTVFSNSTNALGSVTRISSLHNVCVCVCVCVYDMCKFHTSETIVTVLIYA